MPIPFISVKSKIRNDRLSSDTDFLLIFEDTSMHKKRIHKLNEFRNII